MARYRSVWLDARIVGAQWLGVLAAGIVAGTILGILLSVGVGQTPSRITAVMIGAVLAITAWEVIGRHFARKVVGAAATISSNVVRFEEDQQIAWTAVPAFAVAVMCVYVQTPVQSQYSHGRTLAPVHVNAIPKV